MNTRDYLLRNLNSAVTNRSPVESIEPGVFLDWFRTSLATEPQVFINFKQLHKMFKTQVKQWNKRDKTGVTFNGRWDRPLWWDLELLNLELEGKLVGLWQFSETCLARFLSMTQMAFPLLAYSRSKLQVPTFSNKCSSVTHTQTKQKNRRENKNAWKGESIPVSCKTMAFALNNFRC